MSEQSKNPDYLLTLIKKDETRGGQGKLKVFLGMVAGVGKTYAMLQSAQQLKSRNVDVVVGLVETHGRQETAALLSGLEILPRKRTEYRGVEIDELDIDAILQRKPKVVLVDEFAHTNAPGSRHNKRYLDVLEIIEAGIDVYTTVNVQHLESRVDTVQEITKVIVQETIPDSVLDRADEVVLIDLPPEELLKRLSEGRVYPQDSAELASKHFFQKGNLTALREMALRVAAERVDRELRDYKTLHGIEGVWKAGGRLMVAVFASPYSEVLIRWTRRVADLLGVTWIGAYVESDNSASDDEKKLLAKNISLVQQLGGEIVSTRDDDPVTGLLRIAQQNNVTQIIVGKSQRKLWQTLFSGGSIVSRLLRQSGNIDVYAVSTSRAKGRRYLKATLSKKISPLRWDQLGWVFAIAMGTWLLATGLEQFIGYVAVGVVFLLAVSLSGLFLARSSVLLLALIFATIHNYFFIPPLFTFTISKPEDFMVLAMYFVAAAVIGHLTTRLASKERMLRSREDRAMTLYSLAKDIAAAQSGKDIFESAVKQLENVIEGESAFLMRDDENPSRAKPVGGSGFSLDEKETAVAAWVLEKGKIAGSGTDTLSAAQGTYIPIIGKTGVLAVLGIKSSKGEVLDPQQLTLIEAYLNQIAAGLERETYHDRVRSLLVVEETQKLYKALLDSVSHELKTPLSTIKGSASALVDSKTSSNQKSVESLGQEILGASSRLQRLVENLLDMTRIESGMIEPRRDTCDVSDIIGTVLREIDASKGKHKTSVDLPSSLSPVMCDPVLIDQALINIVHNAFLYTPPESEIEMSARDLEDNMVEISVRDHGPGLPIDHPEKVLEKFYRGEPRKPGGVGLGLSIARGFIEAQKGQLKAANHKDGGAVFSILLPKGVSP